jgi:hypothetical protein
MRASHLVSINNSTHIQNVCGHHTSSEQVLCIHSIGLRQTATTRTELVFYVLNSGEEYKLKLYGLRFPRRTFVVLYPGLQHGAVW